MVRTLDLSTLRVASTLLASMLSMPLAAARYRSLRLPLASRDALTRARFALACTLTSAPVGNANKLLVLSDEDSIPALRAALEEALRGQPARVVKALDWTLEILPARTSKAAGLRRLLDALDIAPRRVMAVGDGENDIEMMRMVGLPVAMGNATPLLKKHVAFVTASNSEDGVAKAILEHALPRAPANVARRRDRLRKILRLGSAAEP